MARFLYIFCAIAAICSAGLSAANAHEHVDKRFYLAPLASYSFFDENNFDPDDDFGLQFAIGKNLDSFIALELFAFYFSDVDLDRTGGNFDSYGVGLDALIFPARHLLPIFLIAGGGFGEHDFDQTATGINDRDSSFYDFGAGVQIPITDSGIALRGEYRYRHSDIDAPSGGDFKFRDNVVSLGLQIPLGRRYSGGEPFPWPAERRPAPAAPPRPPQTVAPRRPGPIPAAPTNNDLDNDGVINRWDKCPSTPANATVDLNGCTADPQAPLFVLEGVNFAYDSARLTQKAQRKLNEVAQALAASPYLGVRIEGHTDNIGGQSYNLPLSQQRARSVLNYLTSLGLQSNRFQAVGYGQTRPVAPNSSSTNRARNRRVELHSAGR